MNKKIPRTEKLLQKSFRTSVRNFLVSTIFIAYSTILKMSKHLNNNSYKKFTIFEKAYSVITFNTFVIIGADVIYKENKLYYALYILFLLIGVLLIIRYWICPRCLYIMKHSDCRCMPYSLTIKIIKEYSSQPMNKMQTICSIIVIVGSAIIPQYWLIKNPKHFVVFWIFATLFYGSLPLYSCRKCFNSFCPFNTLKLIKKLTQP